VFWESIDLQLASKMKAQQLFSSNESYATSCDVMKQQVLCEKFNEI